MDINNQTPILGQFAYSPIYFFVKKEGQHIKEIYTLKTPTACDENISEFIQTLKKKTGIKRLDKVVVKKEKSSFMEREDELHK